MVLFAVCLIRGIKVVKIIGHSNRRDTKAIRLLNLLHQSFSTWICHILLPSCHVVLFFSCMSYGLCMYNELLMNISSSIVPLNKPMIKPSVVQSFAKRCCPLLGVERNQIFQSRVDEIQDLNVVFQIVAIKKFMESEEDPAIKKIALREIRMLKVSFIC